MREMHKTASSLVAVVLFLLALLLCLHELGTQSLWLDEGSTWQTIQLGWGALLADMLNPTSAYPLYHVVLKAWVSVAGDSEWALRFPSALAGASAVVALYATAIEIQRFDNAPQQQHTSSLLFPLAAALLLLTSPFALWYAQEVKVYSLFLLISILVLWSLLRALRLKTQSAWLLYGAIALTSVFVHRLAVLLLIASYAALLTTPRATKHHHTTKPPNGLAKEPARLPITLPTTPWHWATLAVLSASIVAAMVFGLGSEGASTGAHIPAGPGLAAWLTFVRFGLNRGPSEIPWWWLVPWATLTLWGAWALARSRHTGAKTVLACFLIVPLMLFLVQVVFTRFYEARYLMMLYPAWVLMLAYPLIRQARCLSYKTTGMYGLVFTLALAIHGAVLMQPQLGLFSGAPVKEEFRKAIAILADHVHPDDLIVLHPAYLEPLYTYYMQHTTTDPPPKPALFAAFKQGQTAFSQRDWDAARKTYFAGHTRSFLLISPEHARTIDIPQPGDEYGLVGLYYRYSREQEKWPCGIWKFNGVHVLCQESPEAYETGQVQRPATPMQATFGPNHAIDLLGYTLKATTPDGVGVYRPGGVIPLTLFWEVRQQLDTDYHVFLHLCRDCAMPPVASDDGPPLQGYLPTHTWLPNKPARDDRAIPLPHDIAPGHYTLLIGLYDPTNPSPDARLVVQGDDVLANNRLVLQRVEIEAP